jgi:hypothetical protein
MKVETMIEWLKELPPDYEMCFSEYTAMVVEGDTTSEEYFVVLDMPIVGMIKNDENKEVRFFTQMSHETAIKQIENGKNWRPLGEEADFGNLSG